MFDFIGSRMQKAIAKANKKTQLKEEDILDKFLYIYLSSSECLYTWMNGKLFQWQD